MSIDRHLALHRPFRKDVQVLRGIAVLMVVTFHLGSGALSAGFLGVDVFFVVSGYLMAVVYDPARKAEFFAKRARRLLPAYFAVILVTLLAAVVLTTPNDFRWVFEQAAYASVFASNIGYWMENSYFEKDTFKPLLHLWSLGVEIQFYLLVPAIFWILRQKRINFALIGVVSALLCFAIVGISPKTSFFLLPLRLWEFMLGFGVAKAVHERSPEERNSTAWIGFASLVAVICMAFFPVDGQSLGFRSGHPGLAALLMTALTSSTLFFGIPCDVESHPISTVLARVGDYSYSIYLAHFPVIVLVLYHPFSGTVLTATSLIQGVALLLAITVTSLLLFHFIEQPLRKGSWMRPAWGFAAVFAVMAIGGVGILVQKMVVPEREMLIYQASFDRDAYRCGKLIRFLHPTATSCEISKPIPTPQHRVLLVGNSHADSIKATFAEAAEAANASALFVVENRPLILGGVTTPEQLVAQAQARGVDAIVLHYSPGTLDPVVVDRLAGLAARLSIHLAVILPVPVWERPVPLILLEKLKTGQPLPDRGLDDYQRTNQRLIKGLSMLEHANLTVYPIAQVFCQMRCALESEDGKPLYFDSSHLTLTGSKGLRPVFDAVLADIPRSKASV